MCGVSSLSNEDLITTYNSLKVQDAIYECVLMFMRPLTRYEAECWDAIGMTLEFVEIELIRRGLLK